MADRSIVCTPSVSADPPHCTRGCRRAAPRPAAAAPSRSRVTGRKEAFQGRGQPRLVSAAGNSEAQIPLHAAFLNNAR
jgi:hypothetical protein